MVKFSQVSLEAPKRINPILLQVITEWILDGHHAIQEIETESFRRLVQYLNPYAVKYIPKKGDIIRGDIMQVFQNSKMIIMEQLLWAPS